jgi:TP901 family phage tail tape measure protein
MFGSFGSSGSLGMGVVLTLVDDFSANAATAESSMRKLGLSVDTAASRIDTGLARIRKGALQMGIGLAILLPFAGAASEAAKFEHQLSSIRAVTGATAEQMKLVQASIMSVGPAMGYSASEAGKGIEELVKAGVDFTVIANGGLQDALDLARAGELSLEEAATLASGALNAFSKDNLTLAQAANYMAGAANVSAISMKDFAATLPYVASQASLVGVNFKDVSTGVALLGQNFIKGSQAGTTLANFLGSLKPSGITDLKYFRMYGLGNAELIKGTDGLRQSMGKTSSVFYDQNEKIKSLAEIAEILREKFKGLSELQLQSKLEHIFGAQSVAAAIVLMKAGAEGVNKMEKEIAKITAHQVAMERLNNLLGQWSVFKAEFNKTAIVIGTMFLPVLRVATSLLLQLNKALLWIASTPLGEFALKVLAGAGAMIALAGAFNVVKGAIMIMWASASPALAGMWAALLPLLPILLPLGAAIYLMVKEWRAFNEVVKTGTVNEGWLGFLERTGAALTAIVAAWNSWNGETFNLGGNEDTFAKMGILEDMQNLGTWVIRIKSFFDGFFDSIKTGWTVVGDMFTGLYDNMLKPMFDALGIDMKKLFGSTDMWKMVGQVIGWIVGGPLMLLGAALAGIGYIVSGIVGTIGALVYGIGELFMFIGSAIADLFDWIAGTSVFATLLEPFKLILMAIDAITGTNMAGSIGEVQPAYSGGSSGKVNELINNNSFMKAQPHVVQNTFDKSVTKTDSVQVNLHMDGDVMYKKFVKLGDQDNARQ